MLRQNSLVGSFILKNSVTLHFLKHHQKSSHTNFLGIQHSFGTFLFLLVTLISNFGNRLIETLFILHISKFNSKKRKQPLETRNETSARYCLHQLMKYFHLPLLKNFNKNSIYLSRFPFSQQPNSSHRQTNFTYPGLNKFSSEPNILDLTIHNSTAHNITQTKKSPGTHHRTQLCPQLFRCVCGTHGCSNSSGRNWVRSFVF